MSLINEQSFTGGFRLALAAVCDYHFSMFTAVYRKSGKWWAAYLEEVPGVNTQGATLTEARANLKEALARFWRPTANKSKIQHCNDNNR